MPGYLISDTGDEHELEPDGAGYVLIQTSHGSFDLRPDGMHRLGIDLRYARVLAAGGGRALVAECAGPRQLRCPAVLVQIPSGTPRRLGIALSAIPGDTGVITPDGRTALVEVLGPSGQFVARLFDLRTGRFRGAAITVAQQPDVAAFSPDGRWAFLITSGGRLVALDVGTGEAHAVGGLPHLTQLAVRPS